MIETILKYCQWKDFNNLLAMHTNVTICRVKDSYTIYFNDMEASEITSEEINDLPGRWYVCEVAKSSFACGNIAGPNGISITLIFN